MSCAWWTAKRNGFCLLWKRWFAKWICRRAGFVWTGARIGNKGAVVIAFDCITLFPEVFDAVAAHGITRRAKEEGKWSLSLWNPRDFTEDNYRTVDDRPYGGGPGMVRMPEPIEKAIAAAKARDA